MRERVAPNGKVNVTGRLISAFKQLISEGILVPGCRLPPERELAESFGVARSSLRQALKVLEVMGVISQQVGVGTFLNSAAPSILGESLEFLILLDGISFHDLMEARLVVEPELAARAAAQATRNDISDLANVHQRMDEKRGTPDEFIANDLLFHQTIFRIAGNRTCSMMFSVIHQSVHRLMELTSQVVDPGHTLLLHRRILTAIRRNDPESARQRMIEHLQDASSLVAKAAAQKNESALLNRVSSLLAQTNGESLRHLTEQPTLAEETAART
jgi:GntR family transcriptional repressor for pyruvate dehydrogenase complex